MKIRFVLYKNAFVKQTFTWPNKKVTNGFVKYTLIARFPKFMYQDVRKIVEKYQGANQEMDVVIYRYITYDEFIKS